MAVEITRDEAYLQSLMDADTEEFTPDEFDPDADYARPAPPIPVGVYQMKFSNGGVFHEGNRVPYRSAQWKNETKPHFEIAIKGVIIAPDNPKIDGKFVFTGFPLTTKPEVDRGNQSAVGAAYRALTGKPIPGTKGSEHVVKLDEVLLGEPIGYARVQNILRDSEAEKAAAESGEKRPKTVYGQKKIMALKGGTDSQGNFTGAADHPETGNRCAARAELSS